MQNPAKTRCLNVTEVQNKGDLSDNVSDLGLITNMMRGNVVDDVIIIKYRCIKKRFSNVTSLISAGISICPASRPPVLLNSFPMNQRF